MQTWGSRGTRERGKPPTPDKSSTVGVYTYSDMLMHKGDSNQLNQGFNFSQNVVMSV